MKIHFVNDENLSIGACFGINDDREDEMCNTCATTLHALAGSGKNVSDYLEILLKKIKPQTPEELASLMFQAGIAIGQKY